MKPHTYRHYNPSNARFLSEDPIGFLGGDMNLYRYVNNDPMNFSDPSGLLSYRENLARREAANANIITTTVKTGTSIVIASAFNAAARRQVGLGIGLGEFIRNRGLIATLGTKTGTVGAFALSTAFKSIVVGTLFTAGQEIGNRIGAGLDTLVDDAHGRGENSIFETLFFGSGIPNQQNSCGR